jgi:antitoxin VapB
MAEFQIAKLFKNGGSQAVRLPSDCRFEGDQVRVRRVGKSVVIEPMIANAAELFARIDDLGGPDFRIDRDQPEMPIREVFPH